LLPPALDVAAYIDDDWFEKEQSLLFRRLWQFVTFKNFLDKPGAFVTKILFGVPVVLQNFGGEIKAFENICLHRQAPIQTKAYGRRPLTCHYHGWNYGADGRVTSIPFEKEYYLFPDDLKEKLCLRQFAVEVIGSLIFISLSPNPLPIKRQFSEEFLDSLEAVSLCFDCEMITTTYRRKFNWKLIFENLRDGVHPSFLHRDTLYQDVKFKPKAPPPGVVQSYLDERRNPRNDRDVFEEVRAYFSKGGPDTSFNKLTSYPWHDKVQRFGNENVYYNWLAFPNLHIASGSGGYSFIIEHYIPRAAGITDVDIYYLTAMRTEPYSQSKAVLYEHLAGADRVLNEDFQMLELTQSTLHKDGPFPRWGAFELRNHRISTWIREVINGHITF
jgi:phenylpropionate dioxygenase-like ring-hydroxylating dioxygenase large terminal subunit